MDECVLAVIADRLSQDDAASMLAPAKAELAPLLVEAERLRDRLAVIESDYDAGLIDGRRYASAISRVQAEQRKVEQAMAAASNCTALGDVLALRALREIFARVGMGAGEEETDTLIDSGALRIPKSCQGSVAG